MTIKKARNLFARKIRKVLKVDSAQYKDTPKQDQEALEVFFSSASFLTAPGKEEEHLPYKYLWDDFDAVKKELEKAKEAGEKIYIYTLIEENNAAYIFEGYFLVNRLGHFLSNKLADYKEPIRYW